MKKVLISAVAAGAILSSVGAIEVYNEGGNTVDVYGQARAVIGYGQTWTTPFSRQEGALLFGVQGNSWFGTKFKHSGFFGDVQIGANEATVQGGASLAIGFRLLYIGYDFGNAGKLSFGKNHTLLTMSGFSSNIFDTDNASKGFGGYAASVRRIQVAYEVAGLGIALSENDTQPTTAHHVSVPRLSIAYNYKSDALDAKIGATYTYGRNAAVIKNVVGAIAGFKAKFNNQHFAASLMYGHNLELTGEAYYGANPGFANRTGSVIIGGVSNGYDKDNPLAGKNSNIYGAHVEYGINFNESVGMQAGGGYQLSTATGENNNFHNYGAYIQLPCSIVKNFSIIPQIGYYGRSEVGKDFTTVQKGGLYAFAQLRANF